MQREIWIDYVRYHFQMIHSFQTLPVNPYDYGVLFTHNKDPQ